MRVLMTIAVALLLAPAGAAAQPVDAHGAPYREWDVDGSVGFDILSDADGAAGENVAYGDAWNPSWAGGFDLGRYWTGHLKSSVGLTFLQDSSRYVTDTVVPAPGVVANAYTWHRASRIGVSVAGTWQFFDNAFMHPYVSAGLRTLVLDVVADRQPYAYAWGASGSGTYRVPEEHREYRTVRVRPFVAVGSKSYFAERAYVRPEVTLGFNNHGLGRFGARLAFGVDF